MTKVCVEDSYLPSFPLTYLSAVPEKRGIEDCTGTNLVNPHRLIYQTITNALNSQGRSYSTFCCLVSEHFCKFNRTRSESFEKAFQTYYDTIHRHETNRLRNNPRFFGHLANDAISWTILQVIKMNEGDG